MYFYINIYAYLHIYNYDFVYKYIQYLYPLEIKQLDLLMYDVGNSIIV